jgi:hypothetical protein
VPPRRSARLQTADPDADLNNDGIVNFGDFQIMRPHFDS